MSGELGTSTPMVCLAVRIGPISLNVAAEFRTCPHATILCGNARFLGRSWNFCFKANDLADIGEGGVLHIVFLNRVSSIFKHLVVKDHDSLCVS